jgi:hypothetical protein
VITVVVGFVAVAIVMALSQMIGDELRGSLELAPRGLLRLAALRLPADQRQFIYNEEWLPELIHQLREADGRPISRLVFGIKYAADMVRGAGVVGRQLDGVRGQEQEEARVFISDGDVGNAAEFVDVYRDGYGPIALKPGELIDSSVTMTGKGSLSIGGITLSGSGSVERAPTEPG